VREMLVKQRTMLINAIHGHAAEFGVTAKGPKQVTELLRRLASEPGVPELACAMNDNKVFRIMLTQRSAMETQRAQEAASRPSRIPPRSSR